MSNDLFIPHYDDTELQRQLITLAREKKTTVGAQIIAASRRICANLAYQTEPMGNDDTAKIVGQNAVERDIKKVYARASDAYGEIRVTDEKAARAFYSAMMQGRTDRATKILMNSKSRWRNVPIQKFTPQTHKDARRNGKVYKKIPVSIVIMGDPLDKYIVRMKKRTGLAAAGFSEAAKPLGGVRGIPGWKKGKKGTGRVLGSSVNLTNSDDNPKVQITNHVPYAQKVCPQFKVDAALAREEKVLEDLVRRAIKAAARKARLA